MKAKIKRINIKENQKKKELEEKHWNECRQISQYEEENRMLKEEVERLKAECTE